MFVPSCIKISLIFCLSYFFSYQLLAQQNFLQIASYDSLLNVAKASSKPIFVVIHPSGRQFSPFGGRPMSPKAMDIINEQFVSGTVEVTRNDFNHPINQRFHVTEPIYLFADKDGYPLLVHNSQIYQEEMLLGFIDSVKTIAEGQTMGVLLQQYRKGIRNRSLLRSLLEHYQTFDAYVDLQVLEDYVSQLTVQELNNFEMVVFLLSAGPVYDSRVYQLANFNQKMVDSLYKTLPNSRRTKINNRIIERTFREALNKGEYSLAQKAGQFAGNTWQPNYLRAQASQLYYPMEYRRLMRDTVAFIQMARNYYRNCFYRVNPDSSIRLDYAKDHGISIPLRGQILPSDSVKSALLEQWVKVRRRAHERTQIQNLNYGANCLLDFGTDDLDVLFDAIRWMRKSISLDPKSGQSRHILAKVLYRAGFYAEAEAEQHKAVELYQNSQRYHEEMKDALEAMQARSW